MNYANMIEEKGLKKGFIVATLVSTIVGTFTTSLNFYDRVQERKAAKKQNRVDDGQNKEIQSLREDIQNMRKGGKKDSSSSRSRSRSTDRSRSHRHRRKSRRRSVGYDDDSDEDFRRLAGRSRAMIEREYDENYLRLGQRYAQGDVVTENKLQAQIITLQQAVINVLQDALMDGRSLTKADIHRLVGAQERARDGSLEALRGMYDRLLPEAGDKRLRIEGPPERNEDMRLGRQMTLPVEREREEVALAPVNRVKSMPVHASSEELYCRYSSDLQASRVGLAPAFPSSGGCRCPDCGIRIPVSKQDAWTFEVRIPVGDGLVEKRMYEMDARMVVKSHTPYGDYACVLCSRERDMDCICKSVEVLLEHLGRIHSSQEFEHEKDMHRV
ncbi:uncharacterized protein LTR77_003619 [Saxophila tyrrhenica]|uniref:Uncharacterized protein n=1 Tax=Saxophila tyrrhenica TaxID=1690608 RepID=A0AAV9PFG9_9PEZI|nr:hypothetical protein LTR77_003619 [Saxophila tyrrhenica]